VDEIIAEVDSVTPPEIQALTRELFRPDAIALTVLGNLGDLQIERADLAC
jgi:predicted Zn-dependent peptidase